MSCWGNVTRMIKTLQDKFEITKEGDSWRKNLAEGSAKVHNHGQVSQHQVGSGWSLQLLATSLQLLDAPSPIVPDSSCRNRVLESPALLLRTCLFGQHAAEARVRRVGGGVIIRWTGNTTQSVLIKRAKHTNHSAPV